MVSIKASAILCEIQWEKLHLDVKDYREIINVYKDYTLTFLHKGLPFGSLKKSRWKPTIKESTIIGLVYTRNRAKTTDEPISM